MRTLWEEARRQQVDAQIETLLQESILDSDVTTEGSLTDATIISNSDLQENLEDLTATEYVAEIMKNNNFPQVQIPPSPDAECTKPSNSPNTFQLESWEEEKDQTKPLVKLDEGVSSESSSVEDEISSVAW